jgi:hypothetical protein
LVAATAISVFYHAAAAHGHLVDLHKCRADRDALPFLAADADTFIELEIVTTMLT